MTEEKKLQDTYVLLGNSMDREEKLTVRVADAEKCIQDLQDLLAEQPLDSFRPLIIAARAHLGAYQQTYKKPKCEQGSY